MKKQDRTFKAGQSTGLSKTTREATVRIKNEFGFSPSFNLFNALLNEVLSYDANKPIPSPLTNNQRNARNNEIISLAEKLKFQLKKLGQDEIWHVQKKIHERNSKLKKEMLDIDPNADISLYENTPSYFDLCSSLTDSMLPCLINWNQIALTEKQDNQAGRKENVAVKSLIINLLRIYVKGTGKKLTYTRSDSKPHQPFSGEPIIFCETVIKEIFPKESISNSTIGEITKKHLKSCQY